MKKILLCALMWVAFCQVSIAQKNKKVLLAFNFKVGDIYQMEVIADQKMYIGNDRGTQGFTFGASLEVVAINPDKSYDLKMTYNVIKYVMYMPGVTLDFDSSKEQTEEQSPEFEALKKGFAQLLGKWVVFRMKQNGELLGATDGDEALKKVFKDQNFTFGSYPAKPIKIGSSWTITETRNMNGVKMKMVYENKLVGLVDGNWVVASKGVIKDEKDETKGTLSGTSYLNQNDLMQMKTAMKQNLKDFDVNRMKMDLESENTITCVKK